MSEALDRLAALAGIEPEYADYFGRIVVVSDETKRALLAELGYSVDDAALEDEIVRHEETPWLRALEPVQVARLSEGPVVVAVTLPAEAFPPALDWTLRLEDGQLVAGRSRTDPQARLETREIGGRRYERRAMRLAEGLPLGYHRLHVAGAAMALIVVPARAWTAPQLDGAGKTWGFSLQLYSLRSSPDWGIGDFGSLRRFVRHAGALEAQMVGLNPLHATSTSDPQACSPYDPVSRLWLNPLYVEVEAVEDFAESPAAQAEAAALEGSGAETLIDYEAVSARKLRALALCHASFCAHHRQDARGAEFAAFVDAGGPQLEGYALFAALAEELRDRLGLRGGWSVWPEELRDPGSEAVRAFAATHAERIDFHKYLQWQADRQLGAVAREYAGATIGLYRDLAVGTSADGADSWMTRDAFIPRVSVGAPPDQLNTRGQNWGLTPFHPEALRALAYEPFVRLLRANMRHAGALRIDHAMAIMRLFLIPHGRPAREGAYIRYPLSDLLGILALESTRARCMIVGEDLGTVPAGFREQLAATEILGFRLLYFQRRDDGTFIPPEEYPAGAMVCTGTHDLPSLPSWWTGTDIDDRERLGVISLEQAAELREERSGAREHLLAALSERAALPREAVDSLRTLGPGDAALAALVESAYRYLAESEARLLVVQLEDVLRQIEAVNIPGTRDEHPNWSRRLRLDVDALARDAEIQRVAATMRTLRGRTGVKA